MNILWKPKRGIVRVFFVPLFTIIPGIWRGKCCTNITHLKRDCLVLICSTFVQSFWLYSPWLLIRRVFYLYMRQKPVFFLSKTIKVLTQCQIRLMWGVFKSEFRSRSIFGGSGRLQVNCKTVNQDFITNISKIFFFISFGYSATLQRLIEQKKYCWGEI